MGKEKMNMHKVALENQNPFHCPRRGICPQQDSHALSQTPDHGTFRLQFTKALGILFFLFSATAGICYGQSTWKQVNPLPRPSLFYVNGQFVGLARDRLVVSPDGKTWTVQSQHSLFVTAPDNMNQLYANGKYIVSLSDHNYLTLYSSTDALNWSKRASLRTYKDLDRISGIAFGNNRYVAVSTGRTILTSDNGDDWKDTVFGTGSDFGSFSSIVFANNQFIVSEVDGIPTTTVIFTSPDGLHWEARGQIKGVLNTILFGNNVYLALPYTSTDSCLISADCDTWVKKSTGSGSSADYGEFIEGNFFLYCKNGAIMSSPTGTGWTQVAKTTSEFRQIVRGQDGFVAVRTTRENECPLMSSATIKGPWKPLRSYVPESNLFAVAYGKNKYVAVSGEIITSTDNGGSWSNASFFHVDRTLLSVVFGGNMFVTVGMSGLIYSSSDARLWTKNDQGLPLGLICVTYAAGLFVAVGSDSNSQGAIITSTDGVIWTRQYPDVNVATLNSVTYANGSFYAFGGSPGFISSQDGKSWKYTKNAQNQVGYNLIYANGKFLMINEYQVFTSADCLNWKPTLTTKGEGLCATFGFDKFILVGSFGQIYASPDGETWSYDSSMANPTIDFCGVACGDNQIMAVGKNGMVAIAKIDGQGAVHHKLQASSADKIEYAVDRGVIWVTIPSILVGPMEIRLVSLNGKTLYVATVAEKIDRTIIPIHSHAAGVYLIAISDCHGVGYSRPFFIKQ
jgi:photosystem II stability/assembly factor-like uncharacterized protein